MNGFRTVCDRIYHDQPEKADKAKTQFIIYKNRAQGVFSSDKVFQHAESMPAHMWWEMYGAMLSVRRHEGAEQALFGMLGRAPLVALRGCVVQAARPPRPRQGG